MPSEVPIVMIPDLVHLNPIDTTSNQSEKVKKTGAKRGRKLIETGEYVHDGLEKIQNLTEELKKKGLTKKQKKSIKNTIASLDSRLKKR